MYNYSTFFTMFSLVGNLFVGLLLEITTICMKSFSTLLGCRFFISIPSEVPPPQNCSTFSTVHFGLGNVWVRSKLAKKQKSKSRQKLIYPPCKDPVAPRRKICSSQFWSCGQPLSSENTQRRKVKQMQPWCH